MDVEWYESRYEGRIDKEGSHSHVRVQYDDDGEEKSSKHRSKDRSKSDKEQLKRASEDVSKEVKDEDGQDGETSQNLSSKERILRMKESRTKRQSEAASEVSSRVNKSRKLEKERVLQRSKIFEEEYNIAVEGSHDEDTTHHTDHLAGVKVLHGLDKVAEGGTIVLTIKDQPILADGDVSEELDMLESVEIGEQKKRDEAYKAAKKKTGIYDDKFNDDPSVVKKLFPKYDDPTTEEGITLDERGGFSGEAEKKLEELRRRLTGVSTNNFEDLTSSGKVSSDYYSLEEMLQFKKPKKKMSLRKKHNLDINALEAEAISSGLGVGDLGSRKDVKRQAIKVEQERLEAEMRNNAYQSAYAKANEASKLGVSGPQAIALLATSNHNNKTVDDQNPAAGESRENKVVFTEMEEFVWRLHIDEEARKTGGWTEVKATIGEEQPNSEDKEIVPDEAIHEVAVGKGLSGALKLLKDRGMLKENIEWGGRNMDKKKSKLVGIVDDDGKKAQNKKEIHIERTDEFGRILTPKEAFRLISHKFHGKVPGKMKQEKRMKQYYEELKMK